MFEGPWFFIALTFLAVVLLMQGLMVPVFGEARATRKRLKHRLTQIEENSQSKALHSLLREKYLRQLSPMERRLESLPYMEELSRYIEQAGSHTRAYRVVLASLALFVGGGFLAWYLTRIEGLAVIGAVAGAVLPFFRLTMLRSKRFQRFEEQMPEAIDVLRRALKAGHPFSGSLKLVAEDMDDPIAREFETTFADINYGNDVRRAMLGLLQRIPSVTVMAFVTAILVQKETGGNLAEILDQIAQVIRSRFKFQRKVRTLSAEGRMSAWVLTMVPLVLFVVIWFTTPGYLPTLIDSVEGRNAIGLASGGVVIGIFWLSRIVRIEV
ncbi:MAG: type II secretion system F family protein [Gammaproteobacteria bacterium]